MQQIDNPPVSKKSPSFLVQPFFRGPFKWTKAGVKDCWIILLQWKKKVTALERKFADQAKNFFFCSIFLLQGIVNLT